jgi:type IX secretion system PorP/SprF family membrane protein
MKMRRLFIIGIGLIAAFAFNGLKAQDAQFTQFNASPLFVNPGYTGTTPQQRFTLVSRLQWPNLPVGLNAHVVSYDLSVPNLNSGFGAYIYTEQGGSIGWRQTTANLSYSYALTIFDKWVIRPGLQFGYGLQNINLGDFSGDGRDPDNSLPDESLASISGSRGFFNFAGGLLLYNKQAWLGFAVYNLSEPNVALNDNNVQELPRRFHLHGGFKFPLYRGVRRVSRIPTLAPSFLYKSQGEFSQLDLGVNFEYNPIQVGIWYRGVPFFGENISTQDAVAMLLGIRFQKLEVGYSYDFTISSLGAQSGGAHELSLVFQFQYERAPKPKRSPIACPSFSNSILDQFKY